MSDDTDTFIEQTESLPTVTLSSVASLPILRGHVTRLTHTGFTSPPRLLFVLRDHELPAFSGAIRLLEEVQIALDAPRFNSLPRSFGMLWLGGDMAIELIGVPLDDASSPLWPLTLAGSAAVVAFGDSPYLAVLKAHCENGNVKLLDAKTLITEVDMSSPSSVAALLAAVLGAAAAP